MPFDVAQSGRTRPVLYLEIDGIPWTWHQGNVAPSAVSSPRLARAGLQSASATQAALDLVEGLARPATMTVTLARLRDNDADELLRMAPRGAARFLTLAQSVEQGNTGPYSVVVNEDVTAWPATGVLWIGQEALAYASKDNATKTFTVNGAGRGYYGSQVQEHKADADEGWAPRVYSDCVTWQRRRARVWVEQRRADGTLDADPVCEIDGWLKASPVVVDRTTIEIQLESSAAALDFKIGGEELTTGLQQGQHAFDGETAHRINTILQVWPEGNAFSDRVRAASAAGTATINDTAWEPHQDVFDASLNDQRAGLVVTVAGDVYKPATAGTYIGSGINGSGDLVIAGTLANALSTGDAIANQGHSLNYDVTCLTTVGTAEVIGWPGAAVATWLDGLRSGTTKGASALYADCEYLAGPEGSLFPALRFFPNFDAITPGPLLIATREPDEETCTAFCIGDEMPYRSAGAMVAPGWVRAPMEIQNRPGENAQPVGLALRNGQRGRAWPDAFHDVDEKWIHVDQDVFGAASSANPIQVEATFIYGGEERTQVFDIVSKAAASTVTATASGTLLERAPYQRGFGLPLADWPGQPRTSLRQVVSWDGVSPTTIMLELLLSGQGNGFNDPVYDRLPYGCNLSVDQVNKASFERFPVPPRLASTRSFTLRDGVDVKPLLTSLLKSIGGALTTLLDQASGRRKLTLVQAGHPIRLDSVKTIADRGLASWLQRERPTGEVDETLVNVVRAQVNYAEGEPQLVVTVKDRDSRQEFNRAAVEELDLLGVRLNASDPQAQRAALQPMAAERFGLFGAPRPVFSGGISYSDALLVDPGATVVFSATEAHDYDGTAGLSGVVGRVVSVERNPLTQSARLAVVYFGTNTSGWAPAMRATAAPSSTQLTVDANAYSEATSPVTGAAQTDAGFFAVGDAVEVVPTGDWPNRVTTTITAIAGNTITLAAAHGLSGPDWGTIRPQAYDSVTATLQGYVFLADDSETLGAGGDPARVFA